MPLNFGRLGLAALCAATLIVGGSARAGIVSTSGQLTVVTPPPSLVSGAVQSDTSAIIFRETLARVPAGGLAVDVATPGTYNGGAPAPAPGTIAAGTPVETYYIHSDPVSGTKEYIGSVTFNTAVLGIDILTASLIATDATYGHPGTTYGMENLRGLEQQDSVTLSSDRRTVSFDFLTGGVVDEVRIFTAVPEPSALAMTALSIGTLMVVARRRKARPVA